MIDEAAIHVADVEGAVGAGADLDGSAPLVARDEEVALFADALGGEARAIGNEAVSRDELCRGITDEDLTSEPGHQISAIEPDAAGGGVGAGVGGGGGVAEGDGIDWGTGRLDVLVAHGDAGEWIPLHGREGHHGEHDGIAVAAREVTVVVVERAAELSDSGDGLDFSAAGIVAEVEPGDVGGFVRLVAGVDLLAIEPVAEPDVVVEPVAGAGDLELVVTGFVEGEERFPHIGDVVGVGVFEKENRGARRGEESALHRQEPLDVIEPGGPGHGFVHDPVAIFV